MRKKTEANEFSVVVDGINLNDPETTEIIALTLNSAAIRTVREQSEAINGNVYRFGVSSQISVASQFEIAGVRPTYKA